MLSLSVEILCSVVLIIRSVTLTFTLTFFCLLITLPRLLLFLVALAIGGHTQRLLIDLFLLLLLLSLDEARL